MIPTMAKHNFWLLTMTVVFVFVVTVSAKPQTPTLLSFHGALKLRHGHQAHESAQYEQRFFTQTLDHFSFTPSSYMVFQQKYLINDLYWGGAKSKAPIFVYTGNEGSIEWFANNTGFMYNIAPRFKALLIFIEHRFYGDSMPFGSEEESYKNASTLGYLTSQQALADYATLILDLKKNLSAHESPVVAFGGSYGGMLAAWFRLKYPHIVAGALASSAPILYFDDIVPQTVFYDTVSNDFKTESNSCFSAIKESWNLLQKISNQPEGLAEISYIFKTCEPLKSVDPVIDWLEEAFTSTAMTDYPTPSNFLMPLPAYPVKTMCRIIDSSHKGRDVLSRVFAAASVYYNYTNTETCNDIESEQEQDPTETIIDGWGWQSCTEMVMPLSASSKSMFLPFTFNLRQRADLCQKQTGIRPRPHWITTYFGGHNISTVLKHFASNIIFSNGMRDPWSGAGVLHNISDTVVALVTKQGAHHADLRFSTSEDPNWLRRQRREELHLIQAWLTQYYHDISSG